MKYSMMFRMMGMVMDGIVKKSFPDRLKAVKKEYRAVVERAADIGSSNRLLSSYALSAYFIAMNRELPGSAEDNYRIMEDGLRRSKLLKMSMGSADNYLSPKRLPGLQQWSEQTHKKTYANDWVVDILPGNGEYDLGYDYLECGDCKLCRDEGCPELTKYLCKMDFMLVHIMGLRLERTGTLAEGAAKCDFRFHRN